MHENKKVVVLRCRHCGRIVASDELFEDKTLELQACPYCGSEILDPLNNENISQEVNKMFTTATTTRSITVTHEIQVPDFTGVATFLDNRYSMLVSHEDIMGDRINKKVETKLDDIKAYVTNMFTPFFSMSHDALKAVFFKMRSCNITGYVHDTVEGCQYKVYIDAKIDMNEEYDCFQVYLGIDNYHCIQFTIYRNETAVNEVTPQYIREDPRFLKGWKHYKALLKKKLEKYLERYYNDTQAKVDKADAMNNFLDEFTV